MPKMKANSSAAKRIKVTAGGKLTRRKAMESHLRGKMSAKRRRALSPGRSRSPKRPPGGAASPRA